MIPITNENLRISGVEYIHILELQIHQKICEHATAMIKLEVEPDKAKSFLEHITEREIIHVLAYEEVIYAGIVTDTSVLYDEEDAFLNISLISTSKVLDCIYESHSYQNVGIGFSDVMRKAVEGNGYIQANFNDKATEGIIIQYQETDWVFVRRLAMNCSSFIVPDMTSDKPVIIVGTNSAKSDLIEYVGAIKDGRCIIEVISEMKKGVLETHIFTEVLDKIHSVIPASYMGYPVVGKIFSGIVKAVRGDELQAHITDVDAVYEEGNWWFSYSTIYSSPSNGAGVYSMPQVGEPVRLFFPSENSADAFAASSANVRELGGNSREKIFTSPAGMKVKFKEDGLLVECDGELLYIKLLNDGSIELNSNKQISFIAKNNINLDSSNKLVVTSGKEVYIGTKQSFISLSDTDNTVDIYSPKIFVK